MADMYWPKAHGFLMWASFGFLMPLGIIVVRHSKHVRENGISSPQQLTNLRFFHIGSQLMGVMLGTVGGAIALQKFGSEFRFTHQRLGLSLLVLMWLQFLVGIVRPAYGIGIRPFWYGLHWLMGTGAIVLGFLNIFIGMHVYELISRTSIRTYNVLFSIQLAFFGLIYLLQDRLVYLVNQGRVVKHVAPSANGTAAA